MNKAKRQQQQAQETHPPASSYAGHGDNDVAVVDTSMESSNHAFKKPVTSTPSHNRQHGSADTLSFETDLSAPRRKRNEDRSGTYKSDPKYQKYVQLVERSLQSFDYVNEWADVTAFLTKLGRSFEIYAKFAAIPHKETVAKRLAQCLNPALPTGVHQKALSIYEQIFRQIGNEQLVVDLPLYSYGLLPFMHNASLSAKPQLLGIFDNFFIPLGSDLRPCMKSFTVGLLPGLEEGSADILNRVMSLLDKLKGTVDESFFFQNMFLILITNSEQRESALKYLAQRLTVFAPEEEYGSSASAQVDSRDYSLVARAMAATMTDPKTLVLRAALDLVMSRFPLRTNVFARKDLVLLMKHTSEVVLKKDMSLNRRLYTWLLGPGDTEAEQDSYFQKYALKPLSEALLGSFAAMSSDPDHQHTVLRVLIGLVDKPSISQPILDSIFVQLMQLLITERDSRPERTLPVKLASVSRMFVEMLDPIFAWSSIINQLTTAAESRDPKQIASSLQLVLFFVQSFELDDESTLQVHVPMALLSVLATLDHMLGQKQNGMAKMDGLYCCFTGIAIELYTRVPKSAFMAENKQDKEATRAFKVEELFGQTQSFYNGGRQSVVDGIMHGTGLLYAIICSCKSIAARLGLNILDTKTPLSSSERLVTTALEDICHILRTSTSYAHDLVNSPELASVDDSGLPSDLTNLDKEALIRPDLWVAVFVKIICQTASFATLNVALTTLLEFVSREAINKQMLLKESTSTKFVDQLWCMLSSEHISDHYRITQLIYQIRSQLDARGVERHLAAKLIANGSGYTKELARYAAFWQSLRLVQQEESVANDRYDPLAFSRLMLLVLDNLVALSSSSSSLIESPLARAMETRAWINASIDGWEFIAEIQLTLLVDSIQADKITRTIPLVTDHPSQRIEYVGEFDYGRVNYYLDTLQRYLSCAAGSGAIHAMVNTKPKNPAVLRVCQSIQLGGVSWLEMLLSAVMEYALADAPADNPELDGSTIETTRAKACDLAVFLISQPQITWNAAYISKLQDWVIDTLMYCVLYHHTSIQPSLLDMFTCLMNAQVSGSDAGIDHVSDLMLFSRLILGALTMQSDTVALRKWIKFLELCVPFIHRHISAVPTDQAGKDLMRILVLPCIHSLRQLLSQSAEYFTHMSGLANKQAEGRVYQCEGIELYKQLLSSFAATASQSASSSNSIDVDMLVTLLDAFDILLCLCLRNESKIPVGATVYKQEMLTTDEDRQELLQEAKKNPSCLAPQWIRQQLLEKDMETSATDTNRDMVCFNLVSVLVTLREIWYIFADKEQQTPSTQVDSTLEKLLVEFGVMETGDSRPSFSSGGSALVRKNVQLHITLILEHMSSIQPAEIIEAVAALWVVDNPHWITKLQASVRSRLSGNSTERRRRMSSVSSIQAPRISTTLIGNRLDSSVDSAMEKTEQNEDEAVIHWDWRATDMLETVSGRTPISILTALLNNLHIRSMDTSNIGGSANMSSNASAPNIQTSSDHSSAAGMKFSSMDVIALTRFIELYTRYRLTARSSTPLIPHVMSMLKEFNANAQQNKLMMSFILRMFTELCERIATHSETLEPAHRTYSQELCNMYARMVDNCILVAGRSFDQTNWLRRNNITGGDGSSAPGLVVARSDFMLSPLKATEEDGNSVLVFSEDDIIDQILSIIGDSVIPQLSLLVPDYDRQVGISMNLMHYAVAPAFKSHMTGGYSGPTQALASRSQHFALILRCLSELSHQASLMKVWKREVWEFFCDVKFFPSSKEDHITMSPSLAVYWCHLIRTLLASEKERFADTLAKVTATSSAPALFANREHEALIRALSLRRLSFVIWAGAVNQYLTSLPQIQEKLVEILKSSPHAIVQMEVFLCLRVLLCRVSSHHMSNFWPMLLTELMRLCYQQLNREGREDAESANLFLAACKFLDLLFILGTDDFLVHQWMFITDTIDALYGSRSTSQALLDQLSSRLLSMPATSKRSPNNTGGSLASSAGFNDTYPKLLRLADSHDSTNLVYQAISPSSLATAKSMDLLKRTDLQALGCHPRKRPIITIRSVTSIRDLDAFVHNASVQAYQAAFTLAEPDTEFIEALLSSDLIYFESGNSSASVEAVLGPIEGHHGIEL